MGSLSAVQIAEFKQNGFLVVEDVLSEGEVADIANRADLIAAGEAEHVPETSIQLEAVFRNRERAVENQVLSVRKLYNLAVYDPVMWQHVVHPRIVAIIADLLDTEDLKMYGDQSMSGNPCLFRRLQSIVIRMTGIKTNTNRWRVLVYDCPKLSHST